MTTLARWLHRSSFEGHDPGERRVRGWSAALRLAVAANVLLWLAISARAVGAHAGWQRALSAVFLLGCAYRSLFPTVYLRRLTLATGWTSSVFVARVIATVAEVAFALQLLLLLRQWSTHHALPTVGHAGALVGALLTTAQGFCWYGVATRRYRGELVEESLWTAGGALVLACALGVCGRAGFANAPGALVAAGASAVFVGFMLLHNLPMYLRRIGAHDARVAPLRFVDGLRDMHRRRRVSFAWEDWRGEAAWLTPYFTLGVWASAAMMLAGA